MTFEGLTGRREYHLLFLLQFLLTKYTQVTAVLNVKMLKIECTIVIKWKKIQSTQKKRKKKKANEGMFVLSLGKATRE